MKSIIQFSITKEPEGYYVASGIGHPIVTDSKTLEELQDNIQNAVSLYTEGEGLASLGLTHKPSLLMNIEISTLDYVA